MNYKPEDYKGIRTWGEANGITGAKFDGIAQRKYGEVTA